MRIFLLAAALLLACSPAPAQTVLDWDKPGIGAQRRAYQTQVLQEVNAALQGWSSAWTRDDARALSTLYLREATLVLPDGRLVQGSRAIRDHFAGSLPALEELQPGMTLGFGTSGDVAYKTFRVSYQVAGAGAEPETRSGIDTLILFRQGDGSWKIQMHLSTADAAAP